MKEKLNAIISQKKWNSIISDYSVKQICSELNFNESMHLANDIFFENMHDDKLQQFALNLTQEIRNHFKKEWENDWKNDIFLGHLYSILWCYDQQYFAYKRAYDMLEDPPESLLLLLASCNTAPGTPPINDFDSEKYLMRAISKEITYEGALMMKTLYKNKGNDNQMEYWSKKCEELKKKDIHTKVMIPDVLLR